MYHYIVEFRINEKPVGQSINYSQTNNERINSPIRTICIASVYF